MKANDKIVYNTILYTCMYTYSIVLDKHIDQYSIDSSIYSEEYGRYSYSYSIRSILPVVDNGLPDVGLIELSNHYLDCIYRLTRISYVAHLYKYRAFSIDTKNHDSLIQSSPRLFPVKNIPWDESKAFINKYNYYVKSTYSHIASTCIVSTTYKSDIYKYRDYMFNGISVEVYFYKRIYYNVLDRYIPVYAKPLYRTKEIKPFKPGKLYVITNNNKFKRYVRRHKLYNRYATHNAFVSSGDKHVPHPWKYSVVENIYDDIYNQYISNIKPKFKNTVRDHKFRNIKEYKDLTIGVAYRVINYGYKQIKNYNYSFFNLAWLYLKNKTIPEFNDYSKYSRISYNYLTPLKYKYTITDETIDESLRANPSYSPGYKPNPLVIESLGITYSINMDIYILNIYNAVLNKQVNVDTNILSIKYWYNLSHGNDASVDEVLNRLITRQYYKNDIDIINTDVEDISSIFILEDYQLKVGLHQIDGNIVNLSNVNSDNALLHISYNNVARGRISLTYISDISYHQNISIEDVLYTYARGEWIYFWKGRKRKHRKRHSLNNYRRREKQISQKLRGYNKRARHEIHILHEYNQIIVYVNKYKSIVWRVNYIKWYINKIIVRMLKDAQICSKDFDGEWEEAIDPICYAARDMLIKAKYTVLKKKYNYSDILIYYFFINEEVALPFRRIESLRYQHLDTVAEEEPELVEEYLTYLEFKKEKHYFVLESVEMLIKDIRDLIDRMYKHARPTNLVYNLRTWGQAIHFYRDRMHKNTISLVLTYGTDDLDRYNKIYINIHQVHLIRLNAVSHAQYMKKWDLYVESLLDMIDEYQIERNRLRVAWEDINIHIHARHPGIVITKEFGERLMMYTRIIRIDIGDYTFKKRKHYTRWK